MDDAPRQTLRALIGRHGTGLCSDARRCEALLRDHAGAHRREINILISALKERVPLDLLAGQSAMPRALLAARLTKRLEDHLALTEEAARWAVDSWALALGVATDEEVANRERKRDEEAREQKREQTRRDVEESERRAVKASPPAPPPEPTRPAPPPPPQQQRQQQTAPPPPRTTVTAPKPSPPPVVASPASRPPATTTRAKQTAAAPKGGTPPSPAQAQPQDARPRGRRRTLRGCTVGCLLLVLLALAVFVGGPFVVSVLREEQQQREPSPVTSP